MRITKKLHAKVMLRMLEDEEKVCTRCPGLLAEQMFGINFNMCGDSGAYCRLCTNFVSKRSEQLPGANYNNVEVPNKCPCYKFGFDEAIKRTWIALEAGGYLDTEEEEK